MCFTHDYDWYAEVQDVTEGPTPARTRCDECRCRIHPGEWRHHYYAREHDACLACDPDADTDRGGGGDCEHGEEFEYDRCEQCDRVLKAVRAVELAEGCPGHESQPALSELSDAMHDDARHGDGRYADAALAMFPELASHLWRLLPEHDPRDEWSARDLDPVAELGGEG